MVDSRVLQYHRNILDPLWKFSILTQVPYMTVAGILVVVRRYVRLGHFDFSGDDHLITGTI